MPASKAKHLSSLFQAAIKTKGKAKTRAKAKAKTSTSSSTSIVEDRNLKPFISILDKPSPSAPAAISLLTDLGVKLALKSSSSSSLSEKLPVESSTIDFVTLFSSNSESESDSENVTIPGTRGRLTKKIAFILNAEAAIGLPVQEGTDGESSLEKELEIPWFPTLSHHSISLQRKEVTRERKQKWVFKTTQVNRFNRLVKMCAVKVGTDIAVEIFVKLGREAGVKECNALINVCIEKARTTTDEDVALEQLHRSYRFLELMKERGFQLEEGTYGPVLTYIIDMAMVEEFHFFCTLIKDANPSSLSKLGYYEMLLWIKVDNEEKIQELCNYIVTDEGENSSGLQENYLLALCDGGPEKELLQLLEVIDVTKFSSVDCVAIIFRCLGKLGLDTLLEKFLLAFKAHDSGAENFTNFLYNYAVGNPNLAVEDVILTFKNLHTKLEIKPSSASYEKLIKYCCDLQKVHVALDLVDEVCEGGLTVSVEAINHLLLACVASYNFNLVHRVYSLICQHNLNPNSETFRIMISLCVRIKDIGGAYSMLSDLEKMKLTPTAHMYNALMAGYFREKNSYGALMVLKEMEKANVKPDSKTLSYLISNCESEEDINKYCEELKLSGIQVTKDIFMALINAYTTCGQFEKAKQVVSDKWIPPKYLNEIKSVLVQALASRGQFSDALNMYEEMKQAECCIQPKAIINLIEHYPSDGGSSTILKLLEELNDSEYWFDACCRSILYCVRHKDLSPAVDLLKQLKEKFCCDNDLALEVPLEEVFCFIGDSEPTHLSIGLDLFRIIKDELGLTIPRKCLDFLLQACINAKDLENARLLWKEYEAAGLPYNILNFLRMYQALLVGGDHKAAKILLTKIPKDDPHVRYVLQACQITYAAAASTKIKKTKKKTEKR